MFAPPPYIILTQEAKYSINSTFIIIKVYQVSKCIKYQSCIKMFDILDK